MYAKLPEQESKVSRLNTSGEGNRDGSSIILDFFRGVMIGIADLFPGLSGGTIALIMGIYTRFIKALSSFNKPLLFSLFRPGKERTERIRDLDLVFLVPLLAGIGSAIFLGARGTSYLIENHPIVVMSFFFGFLLLSLKMPWRMVTRKEGKAIQDVLKKNLEDSLEENKARAKKIEDELKE